MNKIILTEDQQPVFDSLWKFVNEGDPDGSYMALFSGGAGSGKSTTIMQLIEKFLAEALFNNIAVCATTNKALKVVKSMLDPEMRDKVTLCTIHSLLGLKHRVTNNGKEVFERDKKYTFQVWTI
jgi:hypothetical protein